MGLAGPKKRVKLSHDPNNTTWANNTDGFGQRILRSQGWQPGDYLGAKNAAHAEFHTSASASHIRVSMKDDTLGLGAKKGSGVGEGECTGLDAFKNLLGRLNGKDEAVIAQEQHDRDSLRRSFYAERKFGSIRFVRGGLLVGDKVQELIDGMKTDQSARETSETKPAVVVVKAKSKKRKAEQDSVSSETESKRKKKSRETSDDERRLRREAKKAKKEKREREKREKDVDAVTTAEKDKAERKAARKAEKAEKKARKERRKTTDSESDSSDKQKSRSKRLKSESTKESTPLTSDSGSGASQVFGRHAVRSKWIAQKRLAVMDTASLNQIFMIKS